MGERVEAELRQQVKQYKERVNGLEGELADARHDRSCAESDLDAARIKLGEFEERAEDSVELVRWALDAGAHPADLRASRPILNLVWAEELKLTPACNDFTTSEVNNDICSNCYRKWGAHARQLA